MQYPRVRYIHVKIKKIGKKTRKVLRMYKMHEPKADIDRLYVKRKGGGRGLLQTAVTHKAETINNAEYFNAKYTDVQFLNIVKNHESNQPNMNSTIKVAAKVVEELTQSNENSDIKRKAYNTYKQN
jgi:predicted GNAT family acetyltransferase